MKVLIIGGPQDLIYGTLKYKLKPYGIEVGWHEETGHPSALPTGCDGVLCIKDICSHADYGAAKTLAKEAGVPFAAIQRKFSKAAELLRQTGFISRPSKSPAPKLPDKPVVQITPRPQPPAPIMEAKMNKQDFIAALYLLFEQDPTWLEDTHTDLQTTAAALRLVGQQQAPEVVLAPELLHLVPTFRGDFLTTAYVVGESTLPALNRLLRTANLPTFTKFKSGWASYLKKHPCRMLKVNPRRRLVCEAWLKQWIQENQENLAARGKRGSSTAVVPTPPMPPANRIAVTTRPSPPPPPPTETFLPLAPSITVSLPPPGIEIIIRRVGG